MREFIDAEKGMWKEEYVSKTNRYFQNYEFLCEECYHLDMSIRKNLRGESSRLTCDNTISKEIWKIHV